MIGEGIRVNEEAPEGSRGIFERLLPLTAIVALALIILILVIMIFVGPDFRESCPYPARISLNAAGNDGEWFNLSVAKTCILEEDNPATLSLSNIGLFVFWEDRTVSYMERGLNVTWITLLDAKDNGLDSSYEGSVIFLDTDGDGLVSKGDSLLVKSFASGGPLREGGYIGLETDDGHLGVGMYECCK